MNVIEASGLRLAARAVNAAYRRDHLAGPPPGGLMHPAATREVRCRRSLWASGWRPMACSISDSDGIRAAAAPEAELSTPT